MIENPSASSVGLRRDMEILELLAGHGGGRDVDGLGVSWIAQRLGREKSQVSRALRSLESEGMVERDPVTRRYRLGWRLFALAARTSQSRLVQVAAPFLRRLAMIIDEDSHLCVLRGDSVLTVLSVPSSRAYHRIWEGVAIPVIMAAASRSLLSDWDDDQMRAILRAKLPGGLSAELGDEKQWLADAAHVREHGYTTTDVELEDGVLGVSAPVRDHRGMVAAAISVSVARVRDEARLHEMGRLVGETARQLSIALGLPPGSSFDYPVTSGP
ncbi:IclR family transcriptional regulator [Streptosporangium sp. KLBMP 9127]|nr:IclR family transcriptional regulator [Streptosporangium sp. KLBMP 9127]